MRTYTIMSAAGVNLGTYEGATPLDAYAEMLRDAGHAARVVGREVETDAPDGDQSAKMKIRRVATDEDIAKLLDEAARAGDHEMVAICERALGAGDEGSTATESERREAREECSRVLSDCEANERLATTGWRA